MTTKTGVRTTQPPAMEEHGWWAPEARRKMWTGLSTQGLAGF